MNQERVIVQKRDQPKKCVEIMMPKTVIIGLFLFLHFIEDGVDDDNASSFSVGSVLVSRIHAASTHVLNP